MLAVVALAAGLVAFNCLYVPLALEFAILLSCCCSPVLSLALLCRSNSRVLAVVALVAGLAAFNCLYVPLALESAILSHPRTPIHLSRLPPHMHTVGAHFTRSLPHTGKP